jgi:hypothetical protein
MLNPNMLNDADKAVIQATIRKAVDSTGEGFLVPDDAVETMSVDIVTAVNAARAAHPSTAGKPPQKS